LQLQNFGRKLETKRPLEDLRVVEKIILEWILGKLGRKV